MYMCIYTHIYIYVCVYIYIYICIYIYTYKILLARYASPQHLLPHPICNVERDALDRRMGRTETGMDGGLEARGEAGGGAGMTTRRRGTNVPYLGCLGRLLGRLRAFWAVLGPSLAMLGPLGASGSAPPGPAWDRLGAVFGRLWPLLRLSWVRLGPSEPR